MVIGDILIDGLFAMINFHCDFRRKITLEIKGGYLVFVDYRARVKSTMRNAPTKNILWF